MHVWSSRAVVLLGELRKTPTRAMHSEDPSLPEFSETEKHAQLPWRATESSQTRRCQSGSPGGPTRQPENSKRAHFKDPAFKNTTKIPRKDLQEKEERKKIVAGGANFWAVWRKEGLGEGVSGGGGGSWEGSPGEHPNLGPTHSRHTNQTHTADTQSRNTQQTRTADTHSRHTQQTHTADNTQHNHTADHTQNLNITTTHIGPIGLSRIGLSRPKKKRTPKTGLSRIGLSRIGQSRASSLVSCSCVSSRSSTLMFPFRLRRARLRRCLKSCLKNAFRNTHSVVGGRCSCHVSHLEAGLMGTVMFTSCSSRVRALL